ncbi:MAG: biotin carboxylase N-terminal domain-containing protein [Myxococcota bacterium]|nr:biotin carboxylase N-terminal domain-containing protein [Myxococcota bacterium]
MIDALLIANRGEIAIRVAKTAQRMGIRTVGVYTPADRGQLHARVVDVAVEIDDYLNATAIVAAAVRTDSRGVHPGVGFLAERADFAQAVMDAGLVWVGPSPQAIESMGSKAEARRRMMEAGVRVLPGYDHPDQTAQALLRAAQEVGFPLIIKPSAGGGGKGMAVVDTLSDFEPALASARRVAAAAFGDDAMVLERFVPHARHIEVQVLGDRHGACVHLHERECSIQRRHQKIIEEAPSCAFPSQAQRDRLFEDAIKAAEAVSYEGAGTVEFVVDGEGNAHFLEMNTRLQVEHPVTEAVMGLDLVEWQIRIACGEALPFDQDKLQPCGWAMEARLYAEQPDAGHAPSSGTLGWWVPPSGVRVDSGVEQGSIVSSSYDPMLAKVVAHGETRAEATRRLRHALDSLEALGVHTNRDELRWILAHPEYASGSIHTGFLNEHDRPPSQAVSVALVAAAADDWLRRPAGPMPGLVKNWRNNRSRAVEMQFVHGSETHAVSLLDEGSHLVINGHRVRMDLQIEPLRIEIDGRLFPVAVHRTGNNCWVKTDAGDALLSAVPRFVAPDSKAPPGALTAPLGGAIVRVNVEVGDRVEAGQELVVLEAMKMEQSVTAPADGVVAAVHAQAGHRVDMGTVLIVMEQ